MDDGTKHRCAAHVKHDVSSTVLMLVAIGEGIVNVVPEPSHPNAIPKSTRHVCGVELYVTDGPELGRQRGGGGWPKVDGRTPSAGHNTIHPGKL